MLTIRITSYNVCYTKLLRKQSPLELKAKVAVAQNVILNTDFVHDLFDAIVDWLPSEEAVSALFSRTLSYNFV